jgi:NRPS condensation-like uncharacterized protein
MHESMTVHEEKKPVKICIPVNLRKYFPSATARNFFGLYYVGYDFKSNPHDLENIIKTVSDSFKESLTPENVSTRMNNLISMEHNFALRAVPLAIKDPVIKLIYKNIMRGSTGTLSNVGRIAVPERFEPYIKRFSAMMSNDRIQVCVCSYNNTMVVNFMDHFVSSEVTKDFFRLLRSLELPIEVVSSPLPKSMFGRSLR